jgi:hypothetical protein
MTDKITIVTDPDDVFEQGLRLLIVDLTQDQSLIISNALTQLNSLSKIIAYSWKTGDSIVWLLDKIYKSNIIVFNADSDPLITGYLAGKENSYYFGDLKHLNLVNKSVLFDVEQCIEVFDNYMDRNGKI